MSLLSAHPPSNTLPLLFLLESTSAAGCDLLLHLTNTSWSGLSFTAKLSPCASAGRLDLCIAPQATCCARDQLRSPGLTPQGQHTIAHSSSGDLWSTRTLDTGLNIPRGVFVQLGLDLNPLRSKAGLSTKVITQETDLVLSIDPGGCRVAIACAKYTCHLEPRCQLYRLLLPPRHLH